MPNQATALGLNFVALRFAWPNQLVGFLLGNAMTCVRHRSFVVDVRPSQSEWVIYLKNGLT